MESCKEFSLLSISDFLPSPYLARHEAATGKQKDTTFGTSDREGFLFGSYNNGLGIRGRIVLSNLGPKKWIQKYHSCESTRSTKRRRLTRKWIRVSFYSALTTVHGDSLPCFVGFCICLGEILCESYHSDDWSNVFLFNESASASDDRQRCIKSA
jgi:hypothetical protein